MFDVATRIKNLPPYLFEGIDKMLNEAKDKGVDIISFGIGDPDKPTPEHIVKVMEEAIWKKENHQYPSYRGSLKYRQAVCSWYERRYNISLDPEKEVLALIGSKEGIAHFPFCFINTGDMGLFPEPSYPVYRTAITLANGKPVPFELRKENNFQPDIKELKQLITDRTKLIFLNYPHNPTGTIADPAILQEIISLAHKNNIIICYDGAYSELVFDDHKPFSILQLEGSREVAIEFNTLSKTFNMTGWRAAWAAGSEKAIEALGRFKTNIDSGIFNAIQEAGIAALNSPQEVIDKTVMVYEKRRNLLAKGLADLGWEISPNPGSFFLWTPVPDGRQCTEFSTDLFQKTGVFVSPGSGYGKTGRGFLRFSLTVDDSRIEEAMERFKNAGFAY